MSRLEKTSASSRSTIAICKHIHKAREHKQELGERTRKLVKHQHRPQRRHVKVSAHAQQLRKHKRSPRKHAHRRRERKLKLGKHTYKASPRSIVGTSGSTRASWGSTCASSGSRTTFLTIMRPNSGSISTISGNIGTSS